MLFNIGSYMPFGVFVFSGFMKGVPRELEEAAAIDGANRRQTFWLIFFTSACGSGTTPSAR
ncbi:ABC transporter permease subunit [Nonomuraea montanisoli]|uniref:ABC transporter permease subunit n=1 Tax=Nonomuraea montanisoli TaxID=2741721 RepID=UPI0019667343|nr:ABC transporter permease subunit [Nonomuraea montanisoli]